MNEMERRAIEKLEEAKNLLVFLGGYDATLDTIDQAIYEINGESLEE